MLKNLALLLLLFLNLYVLTLHIGVVAPLSLTEKDLIGIEGQLIKTGESGHTHIVLEGSSYKRGLEFSRLTKDLLLLQENKLLEKFKSFIPNFFVQKLFFHGAMIWFYGLEEHIDQDSLKEMQGVSIHAPEEYNYLADPLTRQAAYHILHEVGQLFVDEDFSDAGCFVAAIKNEDQSWVIGRNFDFDIENIFDDKKILKWSFPKVGHDYLSVIWAGMVGVVTGVNSQGIYASINAAGSDSFSRLGTPTTIIVKNILLKASSIKEAQEIILEQKPFITEVFVIADRKTGEVITVENSPSKQIFIQKSNSFVLSNHLESPEFKEDKVNIKRINELTTMHRYKRGVELLEQVDHEEGIKSVLSILRDKSLYKEAKPRIGNRGTIDALIASHSILFDTKENTFYVSNADGTSGDYIGYDLTESFDKRRPVIATVLKQEEDLSSAEYRNISKLLEGLPRVQESIDNKECTLAEDQIKTFKNNKIDHYEISLVMGNYYKTCKEDLNLAKKYWKLALGQKPAFLKKAEYLKGLLNE